MLYIDIDGFKEVNERLGRLAGDSALRVIARRLSSVVRPTDELARIGGDEFAILCSSDVSEPQVIAIAARVVDRLAEPISIGDAPALKLGASIGIVLDFPPGTTSDSLLARADEALGEAKAAGRSCWRVAPLPGSRGILNHRSGGLGRSRPDIPESSSGRNILVRGDFRPRMP